MDKNIEFTSQTMESLNTKGYSILSSLITREECEKLISQYDHPNLYRKTISMQRYRFGKGEYKYFDYPLPGIVRQLREKLYQPLASVANTWMHALNMDQVYPETHDQFVKDCNEKSQNRPTPLILKYETGDFNTLHQDLYGDVWFPFQVIIMLSQPGEDYEGGELILTEQTPRAQSKATVLRPSQGDGVIVTTNFRPAAGSRGYYRAKVKHGVSEVTSGQRFTLGIVFHDAA